MTRKGRRGRTKGIYRVSEENRLSAQINEAIKSIPDSVVAKRENKKGIKRNGVRSRSEGDSVAEYVHKMMIANEANAPNEKWTNTHLKAAMLKEFAKYPGTVAFLTQRRRDPINYYRHRYNKGELSTKLSPTILSVRYDVNGRAVHARNPEKPLTRADYILLLYHYDMNVVYIEHTRQYEVIDENYSFFNLALWESLEVDIGD